MKRTTIDYGIDLGTTNSAIAVLSGVKPVVIKNNRDQDITPSAVAIKKDGAVLLGERARNSWVSSIDDAYIEFKRRMGTEHEYLFKSSGNRMKPEQLSAEVLKSLRADVLRTRQEDIQAAVITIPAAFELHQCDATKRAAELAGFKASPLVQEPVAAALSYGFQTSSEKAFWMVYDFGGGTFDAALIKAEEGIINVVNHGGDNFLGGSDIDWAILEKLLIPQLIQRYDLPDFGRGNKRWEVAMRKLKRAIENAKIELSATERTTLEDCLFEDAAGDEVEADLTLTTADVARVAEPIVQRSVEIFQRVLKEKNLPANAVEKVILVGGPTKAPYFREQLRSQLGIALDLDVDPMTAVAEGAAIFAGTQRPDAKIFQVAPLAGEFSLELQYKAVGHEVDPLVAGRTSSPAVSDYRGYTIEFVNARSQWRSGKIPLKADGAFMASLLAERGERNAFLIELLSPDGQKQKTVPDQLDYTIGATVDEQPLTRSIGVALQDNEVDRFFEKGAGLPLKKRGPTSYFLTHAIQRGSAEDGLTIPIIEGDNLAADRNRVIGKLHISGKNVKRDLPMGTEVEITLRINESRLLSMNVYVSALDEDFNCEFDLRKGTLKTADLRERWKGEQDRVRELSRMADQAEDRMAQQELRTLQQSDLAHEIKRELDAAGNDPDAAEKADKRLLEFALKVDEIDDKLKWPTAVAEAQGWMTDLEAMAAKHGNIEQKIKADSLSHDLEASIRAKDSERLKRKEREIRELYFAILFTQDSFWVDQFRRMESECKRMTDTARAEQLLNQGRNYLKNNNIDGLRNTIRQLWSLLPQQILAQLQRGVGSTIVRG